MINLYSDKRIAIVGAGAVGSYYGGLLIDAGCNVTLIARGKHLDALQQNGLIIDSYKHGKKHLEVNAVEKPIGLFDIIIFCVKSQDTLFACEMMNSHTKENTVFVSMQNGIENIEILGSIFKKESVLGTSVFIGASISKPGIVMHSASGHIVFGPLVPNNMLAVELFSDVLQNTKIEYRVEKAIMLTLWKKLLWNVAFNPLSALLESTCGRMVDNVDILQMMNDLVKEGVEAALVDNIIIPEGFYVHVTEIPDSFRYYKTSMLHDIEMGKNPEVDGILGPVIRKLESVGKSAPISSTIYKSLQFKYGKRFLYTPKLTVDIIVKNNNKLLLIERLNPPYGWALPGGFVDYGEMVEHAAERELVEETSIVANNLKMHGVYSDPSRDNRMHTVSIVFSTESDQEPIAGDDAGKAEFFHIDKLPENIAFDHRKIIEDFLKK